jgi:hypothetical protein
VREVSATGLPELVDGGQHRRRASAVTGQRVGLALLLVGIAAATVAVPPLITPDRQARPAPPVPSAPLAPSPITALAPAVTASKKPGPRPCVPTRSAEGGTVEVGTRPACTVYAGSVGNGWRIVADGLKVLPGEVVPDTKETAMRVERSRPALPHTTMALVAATPVGVQAGTRLRLRVWGGRDFGTVLRLATSPGGTAVTLTAPADTWTAFSVKLADLSGKPTLGRVDLTVAADQVPNVNRFFLDDIAVG